MENHLPIIYLVDSAGVFLPMQDEIFLTKNTSVEFSETMRCYRQKVFRKLQPLWVVA